MIKVFRIDNEDLIESTINKWEKENKVKIDNISVAPICYYLNSARTTIKDADFIITIVYHKRRYRKKIDTSEENIK